MDDRDDLVTNPTEAPDLASVAAARPTRREALRGLTWGALVAGGLGAPAGAAVPRGGPSSLRFRSLDQVRGADHAVASGHQVRVLRRWGDPVLGDAPAWDPTRPDAAAQARQFGFNNDFVGYLPLPRGSRNARHGLLFVNHEYTDPALMFPGWTLEGQTPEQTAVEMAAHGGSVLEVRRDEDGWRVVEGSPYGRRITATTPMRLSGPAAGHPRMKTAPDPKGRRALGTLNNCAGGKTPWGTVLMAEENFHAYFGGALPADSPEAAMHRRLNIDESPRYPWHRSVDRFDRGKEPNEANRFGWMVEVDPYDPAAGPIKRTALGRFKHEGATPVVAPDGRIVVYCGDDQQFEYLYKFVTRRPWSPHDPAANRDLLDDGVLHVARFDAHRVTWLPLVHGEGPLTAENGFRSQADVLIETRRAADLLEATPMDRPEDVETNPVNGRVYAMLTNNAARRPAGEGPARRQVNPPNPRPANRHGHVLEIIPAGGYGAAADHTADTATWRLLLLGGNPNVPTSGARSHPRSEAWLSSPDNCAFDPRGRLWIATDQGGAQRKNGIPDGLFACDVDGRGRALLKFFFAVPYDAECCGPEFTPDGRTLFCAVQHPGEGSTWADPTTRWPDFDPERPPRPSIVAITREDGGRLG